LLCKFLKLDQMLVKLIYLEMNPSKLKGIV